MPTYNHSKTIAAYAAAFYNTAIDAWMKFSIPAKQHVELDSNSARIFCSSMNAAFSCELGFKAQLPFKTGGHPLNELFEKLDSVDQQEVVEYVIDESCHRERRNRKGPAPLRCENVNIFRDYLDKCSENFVESRYVFEGKNAQFPFGFTFCLARCLLIPHGYDLDVDGKYLIMQA